MFFLCMNAVNAYFYFELTKEEKDLGGVSMKNRPIFNEMLDHDTLGRKKIPGILGQGEELVGMKCRNKKEFDMIKRLRDLPQVKDSIPVKKNPDDKDIQVKPIVLLIAYLFNLFNKEELADKGL